MAKHSKSSQNNGFPNVLQVETEALQKTFKELTLPYRVIVKNNVPSLQKKYPFKIEVTQRDDGSLMTIHQAKEAREEIFSSVQGIAVTQTGVEQMDDEALCPCCWAVVFHVTEQQLNGLGTRDAPLNNATIDQRIPMVCGFGTR